MQAVARSLLPVAVPGCSLRFDLICLALALALALALVLVRVMCLALSERDAPVLLCCCVVAGVRFRFGFSLLFLRSLAVVFFYSFVFKREGKEGKETCYAMLRALVMGSGMRNGLLWRCYCGIGSNMSSGDWRSMGMEGDREVDVGSRMR